MHVAVMNTEEAAWCNLTVYPQREELPKQADWSSLIHIPVVLGLSPTYSD